MISARDLRHDWHIGGMAEQKYLERVDSLLGTEFAARENEMTDKLARGHYYIFIVKHTGSCKDGPACKICKDIDDLTEPAFVVKYYDRIRAHAIDFHTDFFGNRRYLEELNAEIKGYLGEP